MEAKAKQNLPSMLKYKTHVDAGSMYNTPPCLPVFVVGRTLKWIIKEGGLDAIQARNQKKAKLIYDIFDAHPEFYKGSVVNKEDRSLMNVTWNLPTPELEEKFIAEAKAKKMLGLKGHRSVGACALQFITPALWNQWNCWLKHMEDFIKRISNHSKL